MNESLAAAFAVRLQAELPFLDRVVGIARLHTKTVVDGESTRPAKYPVPITFTADECEQNERYLIPDLATKGIAFFEDGGVQPLVTNQYPPSLGFRQASLRLLVWVNQPLLPEPPSEIELLLLVEKALGLGRPRFAMGDFLDVSTTYTTLPAETSLYGRYSFDTVTPLLLPPYRLLGLDLRVQFRVRRCTPTVLPTVTTTYAGATYPTLSYAQP